MSFSFDPSPDPPHEKEQATWKRIGEIFESSRSKNGFSDAKRTILSARPYRLWQRILAYVRRARMLSIIYQILRWLLMLLHTGTLVLLTTILFFFVLPLLAVSALLVLFVILVDLPRAKKRLLSCLKGKRVYLFFSPMGKFGEGNARNFASDPKNVVLVVSPFWVSPKGLGENRLYANLKKEGEGLFLIRRYLFFSLRRHLPSDTVTIF